MNAVFKAEKLEGHRMQCVELQKQGTPEAQLPPAPSGAQLVRIVSPTDHIIPVVKVDKRNQKMDIRWGENWDDKSLK